MQKRSILSSIKDGLNKDNKTLGLLIGAGLPMLIFVLYYHHLFDLTIRGFDFSGDRIRVLPKILSLSVFPNGLVFYYYITKNKLLTMRGMLLSTLIYAVIMLVVWAYIYLRHTI